MAGLDRLQSLVAPVGVGLAAVAGVPWQVVVCLGVAALVAWGWGERFRHRERLRELEILEKAVDKVDVDGAVELLRK